MKKGRIKKAFQDPYQRMLLGNDIKKFALTILQIAIIVGVSYVILSPVIGMFVNAISSDKDAYNPMVFVFGTEVMQRLRIINLKITKCMGFVHRVPR